MRPLHYIDYDKLSDDVLNLGSRLYLRMNVSLSSKVDKDHSRRHFHREYRYSSRYSDEKLIAVKRSFTYFLSLDKIDEMRESIMIRPTDMMLFRDRLISVSKWFTDDTFVVKDRKIVKTKHPKPITLEGLAAGKYLQFEPVVITWENDGTQSHGVRITLSNPSVFADITANSFYGLYYTISNFNMYQAAQNLVNYMGRPDYGLHLFEIEDEDDRIVPKHEDGITGGKTNRTLPKDKKSFFDKMNDLIDEEDE